MNQDIKLDMLLFAGLIAAGLILGGGLIVFRRYTGLRSGQSASIFFVTVALAAASVAWPLSERRDFDQSRTWGPQGPSTFFQGSAAQWIVICLCSVLLPLLAVPFAARLYQKWIGGGLTEAERRPNMDGVRAWLSAGNLLCAILISFCAWERFAISPVTIGGLILGALLAYPVLNWASQSTRLPPVGSTEDLSREREKVLQLLEGGKITAEEGAECMGLILALAGYALEFFGTVKDRQAGS